MAYRPWKGLKLFFRKEQYGELSDEIVLPDRVSFMWNTPDSVISVMVWYVEEEGVWSWVANSRDTTFEVPYELADENMGRV